VLRCPLALSFFLIAIRYININPPHLIRLVKRIKMKARDPEILVERHRMEERGIKRTHAPEGGCESEIPNCVNPLEGLSGVSSLLALLLGSGALLDWEGVSSPCIPSKIFPIAPRGFETTSPVLWKNLFVDPSKPPKIFSARAGSSPGVVGAKGDGELSDVPWCPWPWARERRAEVGEGGRSAMAAETESSNSAWVIFDREDESMVSINWIAPAKEER
jgi:hypothetical protein